MCLLVTFVSPAKRPNLSRCCLRADSCGSKEQCVRSGSDSFEFICAIQITLMYVCMYVKLGRIHSPPQGVTRRRCCHYHTIIADLFQFTYLLSRLSSVVTSQKFVLDKQIPDCRFGPPLNTSMMLPNASTSHSTIDIDCKKPHLPVGFKPNSSVSFQPNAIFVPRDARRRFPGNATLQSYFVAVYFR